MELMRREGDSVSVSMKVLYLLVAVVGLVGFGGGAVLGAALASTHGEARGSATGSPGLGTSGALVGQGVQPAAIQVETAGRPSLGPSDAAVTMVEFTDYDCPFCRRYYRETFPELMAAYGDRLRYVVRHFPLVSIHPDAAKAAEAAECAHERGRFWEYHDMLLSRPAQLDEASLKRYAAEVGIDTAAFDRCLDDGEQAAAAVQADLREGIRNGVRGTPSFFINGRFLSGALPLEAFAAYIEAELEPGDS